MEVSELNPFDDKNAIVLDSDDESTCDFQDEPIVSVRDRIRQLTELQQRTQPIATHKLSGQSSSTVSLVRRGVAPVTNPPSSSETPSVQRATPVSAQPVSQPTRPRRYNPLGEPLPTVTIPRVPPPESPSNLTPTSSSLSPRIEQRTYRPNGTAASEDILAAADRIRMEAAKKNTPSSPTTSEYRPPASSGRSGERGVRPLPPALPDKPPTKRQPATPAPPPLRPRPNKRAPPAAPRAPPADAADVVKTTSHGLSDFSQYPQPDAQLPSRRPPVFRDLQGQLSHIGPARCFAMCTRHVVTAANALRVWDVVMGTPVSMASRGNDIRIDACCFLPPRQPAEEGQWIWCGLKTGELWEVEAETGVITDHRTGAHTAPITHMIRVRAHIWTLDETGRLQCWYQLGESGRLSLRGQPALRRVTPKAIAVALVNNEELWLCTAKMIEVYRPIQNQPNQANVIYENGTSHRPIATLRVDTNVGDIVTITVDDIGQRVYTGHADGHITIWCSRRYERIQVYKASPYGISALAYVGGNHLWAGFQTGKLCVYDVAQEPWSVIKGWYAHDKGIQDLYVDHASLALLGRLQVASLDVEGGVRIWDGLLCDDWEDARITLRDTEFCQFRDLNILICSWNCDARKPKALDHLDKGNIFLREWLTASPVTPDIIVIGFQEIIDLESKKTTAKSLIKSKKKQQTEEASRRYGLWRDRLQLAVKEAHPNESYSLVKSEHLVGLFSCMFVRRAEVYSVTGVAASMVKTGFGGRYGNKGGIAMRLIINDSSICFANCHLAAGQKEVSQRNTDAAKVLRECELDPMPSREMAFVCGGDGLKITDHEFCFFSGDLNYRIDMQRSEVEALIERKDWKQLMQHDQLCLQRATNLQHPLRSFSERPLDFVPTYKYNRGEDVFDTSEKMRIPAWCDRILARYGGRPNSIIGAQARSYPAVPRIRQLTYRRHECLASDHRPISAAFQISLRTIQMEKRANVQRQVAEERLSMVRERCREAMLTWLVNMGYAEADARTALQREDWSLQAAAAFLQEARLRGF